MTTRPLVSVILPTYNREAYLREAVASVFAQTYDEWELLVIDDGSTDGARPYLATLTDPRVRPILRAHTGNAALLRNEAARAARGVYIAFLDSDDLWLPEKLALQVADLLAHPECGWSYTGRSYIDEQGRDVQLPGRPAWEAYGGWILEPVIDLRALVATSAALMERRLFAAIGGLDEAAPRCEDCDLWIRLAEASPAAVVATSLVKKRLHPEDRGANQLDVLEYMNRIYGGLLARTRSSKVRRLCRRQRARVDLEIVGGCRRAGLYAEARRALWASFRYAGWSPAWWTALLKTLLRPAIPRALLSRYSRARAGSNVRAAPSDHERLPA